MKASYSERHLASPHQGVGYSPLQVASLNMINQFGPSYNPDLYNQYANPFLDRAIATNLFQ